MRPRLLAPLVLVLLLVTCSACSARSEAPTRAVEVTRTASPTSSSPVVTEPAPLALPSSSPPYDLASDREARAGRAVTELGAKTRTAVVEDVFVVVGSPSWRGASFDRSLALIRSSMEAYLNDRFGRKPDEAISIYLFGDGKSYEGFCKKRYEAPCIAHYGFYSPEDRTMVMNVGLGLGTLTHELVHPLVEADFPRAPTWLNEGIASVFEAPVIAKRGEIHGVKNWRHGRLARALRSSAEREHAKLSSLFGMTDETFRGDDEDRNYALARYVCQWLDARGKLWPFYQRWRDTVAGDPTGERAFRDVVGMAPVEADAIWSKWALSL